MTIEQLAARTKARAMYEQANRLEMSAEQIESASDYFHNRPLAMCAAAHRSQADSIRDEARSYWPEDDTRP